MARPTKYDEARVGKICDLLRAGCTRKASAESSGIDFKTFLAWIVRYSSFSTDVSRAEADAENIMAACLQKAALKGDDWRAAEAWLKRRRRDEWGDVADFRQYDMSQFDDTELDRLAAGEPIDRVLASASRRRARAAAAGTRAAADPQPEGG